MKILLCNGAHIGDLILSTAVLPALKAAYPTCQIGFLASSWSAVVAEDHALIDKIHLYDQAAINRAALPKRKKRALEKATWHTALSEVKNEGYDISLDLYTYYKKNSGHFLYQAGIPQRVAHFSCLNPFFYNQILFWDHGSLHMVENHVQMLRELELPEWALAKSRPLLVYKTPTKALALPEKYILLHLGVGDPRRMWNEASWKKLVSQLSSLDLPVVLAGSSRSEIHLANSIAAGIPNVINLAGKLSWRQLLEAIKKASLLIGLESMAGHMAAALDTPALVIYGGSVPLHRWRPFSSFAEVIVPSSWDQNTLAPHALIHTITSEEVFLRAVALLEKFGNERRPACLV